MTRTEAAINYLDRGLCPLPLDIRSKNPGRHGWQNEKYTVEDLSAFAGDGNIGILLGPSGIVDLDLDCIEAVKLAPHLLPQTANFGRASNPRSHWIYKVANPAPFKKFVAKSGKVLEYRSGEGKQTVFPPSLHEETGELVEWGDYSEPKEVDGPTLSKKAFALAGGSVLLRHWRDGIRDELRAAMSGILLRSGWAGTKVDSFLNAIATAAGDGTKYKASYQNRRLGSNQPVFGIPKLREICGEDTQCILDWLEVKFQDDLDVRRLDVLNEDEDESLFISVQELLAQAIKPRPLIGKLIERGGTGQIYGPSGGGKTFVILDMFCSVATGSTWYGHQCEKGIVLYFIGEGHAGIKRRLRAWYRTHGYPKGMENIFISRSTIILDPAGIQRVISQARALEAQSGLKVALIVIDTLARHIQGDENSTKDMSEFIRSVDTVRTSFPESTSFIVHHTGHGSETLNRARGSSALRAALDYEVRCDKGLLTFQKVKDGEIPPPIEFKLMPVEIGVDDDGDPITSCHVVYGERAAKNREVRISKSEQVILKLVTENPGILDGDLRERYYVDRKEGEPEVKQDTMRKGYNRDREHLLSVGLITRDGYSFSIPGQPDKSRTNPEKSGGYTRTEPDTLLKSVRMSGSLSASKDDGEVYLPTALPEKKKQESWVPVVPEADMEIPEDLFREAGYLG